jgi:hypothetical protein
MSLLPIPVGFTKKPNCFHWSIVRHLVDDKPQEYTVDPDIDLTYWERATSQLVVAFPRMGHVFLNHGQCPQCVPEFVSIDRGSDGKALFAADNGGNGCLSAMANALACGALVTLFFRYRELCPEMVRARIDQMLFKNDWSVLARHLLHFTRYLTTETERD